MKFLEKQIEDVFEVYYKQLLSPDFELIQRQYVFKNRRRADLIFVDKNKRKVIVEIKRGTVTREDIGQLFEYRGLMDDENPRILLVAPTIPSIIKKSFEHFGIEYLEFKIKEIKKLYNSLHGNIISKKHVKVREVISEPLADKKIIDGNVAFKVTYNDNDWSAVCSQNVADFNFKNRTWCKIQSEKAVNCQSKIYENLTSDFYPCIDSVALKKMTFYAGHYHGKKHNNEPKRALNIKIGKIALFTSRNPGTSENERFIFAIGKINDISLAYDAGETPYELFHCDNETAVIFNSNFKPKFWDYYRNPNTDKRKWNTGLVRYVDDNKIINLLNDLAVEKQITQKQKHNVEKLLEIYK